MYPYKLDIDILCILEFVINSTQISEELKNYTNCGYDITKSHHKPTEFDQYLLDRVSWNNPVPIPHQTDINLMLIWCVIDTELLHETRSSLQ